MTLYYINEQIRKAIELGFDPETGEILDASALEQLQIDRDEKVENICLYIKDLYAEADAIYNERRALEEREKASEKKADSLSRYLQSMLAGEKFKTPKCAVSYRKTQAVNIVDETLIPNEYLRFKTTSAPDKAAIKDAIKAGKDVPGAMLEERQSMTIK
jgi:hypothetical protein